MTVSLFIGNIPYGAMESEIREIFAHCGTVHEVNFIMDYKRGRFRGFGFVTMPSVDAQRAIRELNNSEFQGRRLIVSHAREKTGKALQPA